MEDGFGTIKADGIAVAATTKWLGDPSFASTFEELKGAAHDASES
jgi:hypothetical protein